MPELLMLLWEVRQSFEEAELSVLDKACDRWRNSPDGRLAVRILETQARATAAQWHTLLDHLNADSNPPRLQVLDAWAVRNGCLHVQRCSLRTALDSLPAGNRERVEDILLTLRRGATRTRLQIERLLMDDRILRRDWADFFAALLAAAPAERIPSIRQWSREHILEGDLATGSTSLGRAVDADEFASHLMSQRNQTYATAQRRLRDLSHATRWTIARRSRCSRQDTARQARHLGHIQHEPGWRPVRRHILQVRRRSGSARLTRSGAPRA